MAVPSLAIQGRLLVRIVTMFGSPPLLIGLGIVAVGTLLPKLGTAIAS